MDRHVHASLPLFPCPRHPDRNPNLSRGVAAVVADARACRACRSFQSQRVGLPRLRPRMPLCRQQLNIHCPNPRLAQYPKIVKKRNSAGVLPVHCRMPWHSEYWRSRRRLSCALYGSAKAVGDRRLACVASFLVKMRLFLSDRRFSGALLDGQVPRRLIGVILVGRIVILSVTCGILLPDCP
jgi:hypothetical protein